MTGVQITASTVMTTNKTYYAQWDCDPEASDQPMCTASFQQYTASSTYP